MKRNNYLRVWQTTDTRPIISTRLRSVILTVRSKWKTTIEPLLIRTRDKIMIDFVVHTRKRYFSKPLEVIGIRAHTKATVRTGPPPVEGTQTNRTQCNRKHDSITLVTLVSVNRQRIGRRGRPVGCLRHYVFTPKRIVRRSPFEIMLSK